MATLYLRDVPDPLHRRFKLLCATRGLSIRAEVSRLIEQELAKVDDIDAALRAVLGPAPRTPPSPTGHLLISQALLGLEFSTYPPASITPSPHPTPFTAILACGTAPTSCGFFGEATGTPVCGTNVPRRAPARARRRPGQKAAHFAQVQRGSWTGRRHQRQGSQAPARPAEAVTRNRRRKLRLSAPAFHRRTGHPDVRGHLSHRPTGRALRHGSALPNRASVARSYAGRAAAGVKTFRHVFGTQ